jgi:hypothetical protein
VSRAAAVPVAALVALAPGAGAAQDDGAYGRLDGDLGLSVEAGVSEALPGESLALRAGVLYLESAGLRVQYNDAFGLESQPVARSVAAAVALRPLFLARLLRDDEQGPAHLDLLVDSIAVELGAYWLGRGDRFCAGRRDEPCEELGVELGTGLELALLGAASTPFVALRAALRVGLRDGERALGDPTPGGLLTLSLGYRHLFATGLVEAGDPRPR